MRLHFTKDRLRLFLPIALFSALASVGAAADADSDGVSDPYDRCPHSNPQQRTDNRGCEFDTDKDGVVDAHDQCPQSDAGISVSMRGCAHDSDKDGVIDYRDRCANSQPNSRVDAHGCPLGDVINLPGLAFAKGSSVLNSRAKSVLQRAVNTLFKYPELKVEVAGYTDSRGDAGNNRKLSQSRANSVRAYMISLGVAKTRVSARGYGEEQPVASNETAAGRAQNRRVVLRIKS